MRVVRIIAVAGALMAVGATSALGQSGSPPPDGRIAAGVSVEGVPVGGLSTRDARALLITRLVKPRLAPIRLRLRQRRMNLKPVGLGLSIQLTPTLADAMTYGRTRTITGPVDIRLRQRVDRRRLAQTLRARESHVRKDPRNVILSWRGLRPKVWPAKLGYGINFGKAAPIVARAIARRSSNVVVLPYRVLRPTKTRVGVVLVVNRGARQLTMYNGARRVRTFAVAVGTPTYPTPSGIFHVVSKQRNPTWFPPSSPWAKGLGPIPPGPGNPLGTRWIGTSASGIGIHGTYAEWTVGTAASHGCIRMRIREVEWLFNYVKIGTVVRIV